MNFGQGASTQGIGQGIGDKLSSGLNSITSGISSVTSGVSQSTAGGFDSFYTMVVAIAVIVLILVLAFLGWTMSKQKATDKFPKLHTTCPDFWETINDPVTGKAYCKQPASGQVNYGNEKANSDAKGYDTVNSRFDFANDGWSAGGDAVCAKKKWANSHGINWDTVTNANYC